MDLAVPYEDINELVALRRTLAADEGATWLLGRCVDGLVRDMGKIGKGLRLLPLPLESGPLGRYFPVYVFVAALPYVRAYHRERGIPDDISRRTLADLGRGLVAAPQAVRRGRAAWRRAGSRCTSTGELFQLGRLQFQRSRVGRGREGVALAAAGLDAAARTNPASTCTYPTTSGPLTPAACDRSLAVARDFFARHFPAERYTAGCCHSWLLDPQLKRYLPADSNIVRFQERFRVACEDRRTRPTTCRSASCSGTRTCRWRRCRAGRSLERAVGRSSAGGWPLVQRARVVRLVSCDRLERVNP